MQKNIIITGASGLVATELTCLLSVEKKYKIYAVSTHPEALRMRYDNESDIVCLSLNDLCEYTENTEIQFDAVVHCAFARSNDGKLIGSSLQFLNQLLQLTRKLRPGVFVNISSQSVYGQSNPPLWTEETTPAPNYLYALGKYASEILTSAALCDTDIKYTNIRLSSVCENARFMNVFAKNALTGQTINVLGGTQRCSFIDVRDVSIALKSVIDKSSSIELKEAYNLGTGTTRTILELAEDTKRIAESEYGMSVEINVSPSDLHQEVGMDISLFCSTFDWSPRYGYDDMVRSLLALNDEKKYGGGRIPVSFIIVYNEKGIKDKS